LNRAPNAEVGPKDFFEVASKNDKEMSKGTIFQA